MKAIIFDTASQSLIEHDFKRATVKQVWRALTKTFGKGTAKTFNDEIFYSFKDAEVQLTNVKQIHGYRSAK